ncbi:hypothetical protein GSI_08761 [Ganoderma sinense ZZ0214-1]|uniref:Uncharacterized protein n=1 Tax=Ganoderma sinense ZZ0214-1 TaxID=1077348 RepID=A0A2G8S4R5_9APHY|nr:hypothetical protein GSI_08761 [Ganoderma sinense ZZ0214-1]
MSGVDRRPPHIYNPADSEYSAALDETKQNPNLHFQVDIPQGEKSRQQLMPQYNPNVYPHPEGTPQPLPPYFGVHPQAEAGQVAACYNTPVYPYVAETHQQPPMHDHIYSQRETSQVAAHYAVYPQAKGSNQQLAVYYDLDSHVEAGQVATHYDHAVYGYSGETDQQPPADHRVEASQIAAHYDQLAHRQNELATDYGVYPQAGGGEVATRYDHPMYIQATETTPVHDRPYLEDEAYQGAARFNPATHQQDDTGRQDVSLPSQQYLTNLHVGSYNNSLKVENIEAPAPLKVEDNLMVTWTNAGESLPADTFFTEETEVTLSSTGYDPQYYMDCGQLNPPLDSHLPFTHGFTEQAPLQAPTLTWAEPNGVLLDFEENAATGTSSGQGNATGYVESNMPVDVQVENETAYLHSSNHGQQGSHSQPDPGGGNVEFALMMLNGMQKIDNTLSQLQENQKQFQNQLMATVQSFTNEVLTLKTSLGSAPRHKIQGMRQGRPSNGEDLTQAMDIASLDSSPEEAQFQQLLSVLKKPKKNLTAAELRIKNQWNRLRSCVRNYTAMVLGVDDDDSLYESQPTLTKEQVEDYGRDKDRSAASIFNDGRVHIDFERSWKKFNFNKEVRKVIIMRFLSAVQSGMYRNPPISPQFLGEFWVGNALDGRITTLRRIWRQGKNPLTEEQKREAARKAAMSSRRKTLLDSRILAVDRRKLLRRHNCLLEMLSPCHMSGDETDGNVKTHPRTFRIINTKYDWENPDGRRAVPGNEPRVRYETRESKLVNNPAPQGLWRNCYDPGWMGRQKEVFVDELCVIDEDYDFTIIDEDNIVVNNQEEGMLHVE